MDVSEKRYQELLTKFGGTGDMEKGRQGFASMDPAKQREIASKGGRAAHRAGTAHEWTTEEAREAGRKGGRMSRGGRGALTETPTETTEPVQA